MARRLGLPADLRGRLDLHRPLRLARAAARVRCCAARRCPTRPCSTATPARPGRSPGVLVGHTHFDHAVDAPAIARRYGAKAYGSASLAHLMRLHGLGDLRRRGRVRTSPTSSGRSSCASCPAGTRSCCSGARCPMDGELTCEHLDGLAPGALPVRRGLRDPHRRRRHLALPPGQRRPRRRRAARRARSTCSSPGVAGRSVTPRYWERILPQARSAHRRPDPLRQLLLAARPAAGLRQRACKLAEVPDEVRAVARDARVVALPRIDA